MKYIIIVFISLILLLVGLIVADFLGSKSKKEIFSMLKKSLTISSVTLLLVICIKIPGKAFIKILNLGLIYPFTFIFAIVSASVIRLLYNNDNYSKKQLISIGIISIFVLFIIKYFTDNYYDDIINLFIAIPLSDLIVTYFHYLNPYNLIKFFKLLRQHGIREWIEIYSSDSDSDKLTMGGSNINENKDSKKKIKPKLYSGIMTMDNGNNENRKLPPLPQGATPKEGGLAQYKASDSSNTNQPANNPNLTQRQLETQQVQAQMEARQPQQPQQPQQALQPQEAQQAQSQRELVGLTPLQRERLGAIQGQFAEAQRARLAQEAQQAQRAQRLEVIQAEYAQEAQSQRELARLTPLQIQRLEAMKAQFAQSQTERVRLTSWEIQRLGAIQVEYAQKAESQTELARLNPWLRGRALTLQAQQLEALQIQQLEAWEAERLRNREKELMQARQREQMQARQREQVQPQREMQIDVQSQTEMQIDVQSQTEMQIDVQPQREMQIDVQPQREQVQPQTEQVQQVQPEQTVLPNIDSAVSRSYLAAANTLDSLMGNERIYDIITKDDRRTGAKKVLFNQLRPQRTRSETASEELNLLRECIETLAQRHQTDDIPLRIFYSIVNLAREDPTRQNVKAAGMTAMWSTNDDSLSIGNKLSEALRELARGNIP